MDAIGVNIYSSNSALNNLDVRVLGYPGDTNYGFNPNSIYQYETGDKITNVSDRYFWFTAYSFEGFSGGPIRRTSDNHLIGVLSGRNESGNKALGVRITQDMINIMASYR